MGAEGISRRRQAAARFVTRTASTILVLGACMALFDGTQMLKFVPAGGSWEDDDRLCGVSVVAGILCIAVLEAIGAALYLLTRGFAKLRDTEDDDGADEVEAKLQNTRTRFFIKVIALVFLMVAAAIVFGVAGGAEWVTDGAMYIFTSLTSLALEARIAGTVQAWVLPQRCCRPQVLPLGILTVRNLVTTAGVLIGVIFGTIMWPRTYCSWSDIHQVDNEQFEKDLSDHAENCDFFDGYDAAWRATCNIDFGFNFAVLICLVTVVDLLLESCIGVCMWCAEDEEDEAPEAPAESPAAEVVPA